jgi:hypothetical protein
MVELLKVVAIEEPDHQCRARRRRSSQFGEHNIEIIGRQMDKRVPRQDTGEGAVRNGELKHRTKLVASVRKRGTGMLNELRDEVDSRCVYAALS